MNIERAGQLRKLMAEESDDPFYVYALALEFISTDKMEASSLLKRLLSDFPEYLPGYYQAGVLSLEQGDFAGATKIIERGITLASKKGDFKTMNELRSLLEEL